MTDETKSIVDSIQGEWAVIRYRVDDDFVSPAEDGPRATLEVAGDRVAGTMGVNRIMGSMGDNGIAGPLASTLMAGPQHLMDQEYRLLPLLDTADRIVVGDSGMTWLRDGLTVVELKRSGTSESVPSS
jgi:heat shock protein HslJ